MSQPFMVLGQPPDPDELRKMQEKALELQRQDEELTIGMRREVLRWSAVLCTCRQRFGWLQRDQGEPPPQGGCTIHGGYMIHPQTGELL